MSDHGDGEFCERAVCPGIQIHFSEGYSKHTGNVPSRTHLPNIVKHVSTRGCTQVTIEFM